jgi:hypothetical protein
MSKNEMKNLTIDPTLRGRANVTQDELRELGRLCREFGVSEPTKFALARLASYPPNIRLSVNLKTVIGLLAKDEKPKFSVLNDGLLKDEYAALVELDMKGLPSHAREIAHGLFNVHERWFLMKELRRLFRGAFRAKEEFISPSIEEHDGTDS